ncbi:hypothetical protein AC1031_013071 [Aphanomyces cochlioides]|nr:hypothetical protein AC1031_013071 [Aphanomyces cochlioides]
MTTSTCTDAVLADSLLVYNKLLHGVDKASAITTQFDKWSFTAIKLAKASTRNHANCVIKSFFHYLSCTMCFPQSCVLAQLAKCADLPDEDTGYDYVAQPQPGYTGYTTSYYHRALLALDTVNTGALAMAGFVAGAAVVAIAQVMLKARSGHGVSSASSYQLV